MLHALVEYGQKENISGEAGFTSKTIRWLINFDKKGSYLGIMGLGNPVDKKNKGRTFDKVPHLKFSGDTPMRQFLVDTAQHALLFEEDQPDSKLLKKHKFFVNLLCEASKVDSFFGKIAKALSNSETRKKICSDLQQQTPKAKVSDNVTFAEVSDTGARILVEDTIWYDWWRGYFPTLFKQKKEQGNPMRCFISGELVEPAQTHPKIKQLGDVGGNIETTLIGFNLDAFCSFGLEQSQNAAISSEMAEQYAAVLNNLLSNNAKRLVGTKVVYWYIGSVVKPEDDPMPLLFGDDVFDDAAINDKQKKDNQTSSKRDRLQAENRVAELLDSIRTGTGKKQDLKNVRYCVLIVSGNAGRVVVRDWMEGQLEGLVENIDDWFKCLKLRHFSGNDFIKMPGIERVITSLLPERKPNQKYEDWVKPIGSDRTALWKAALNRNLKIPFSTTTRVIQLHRSFICTGRIEEALDDKRLYPQMVSLLHSRMAILKAYFDRKGDKNMSHSLNKEYPHPAYHCGRLMYVLARLQKEALPDVKAGIVQRFYAAASSRPALVIGQLITKSKYHLTSLGKEKEGFSNWFEDAIKEIMDAIKAKGEKDIPSTLTLEEQSIFALGYYHQMAYRENNEKGTKTHTKENTNE